MVIEQSSISAVIQPKSNHYSWSLLMGTVITLTATILPILFVVLKNNTPTGSLVSPLPEGYITENKNGDAPTPNDKPLSSTQALTLAKNYLNKAYEITRDPSQTNKAELKMSLDNALKQTELSLQLSAEDEEALKLRGLILTEIKQLLPLASASDSASSNVIIAAPARDSSSSGQANQDSNANKKSFIIPSGKDELTINDTQVKNTSYIYLLPAENTPSIISLKSKTVGSFTVISDTPAETDISVDYYIINE